MFFSLFEPPKKKTSLEDIEIFITKNHRLLKLGGVCVQDKGGGVVPGGTVRIPYKVGPHQL